MARPLRIEYLGAYYHVMNRGRPRRNIFIEDKTPDFSRPARRHGPAVEG